MAPDVEFLPPSKYTLPFGRQTNSDFIPVPQPSAAPKHPISAAPTSTLAKTKQLVHISPPSDTSKPSIANSSKLTSKLSSPSYCRQQIERIQYPPCSNELASKPPVSAEEKFVRSYEKNEQCPSTDTYVKQQKDKGYFGWSLDSMKRLFGSERDLTAEQSRLGFYHKEIQEKLPKIALDHPKSNGAKSLKDLPKEVAKDISTLRDTAREYTRGRSYWLAHKWLNFREQEDKALSISGKNIIMIAKL